MEMGKPIRQTNQHPSDQTSARPSHERIETPQTTSIQKLDGGEKRKYSKKKKDGARCYAMWPGNGEYFWGYIVKVRGSGLYRRYSVSHI
jgi:hypothetical protein